MKTLKRLTHLIADVETGNDDASHNSVSHNFHYDDRAMSVMKGSRRENVNL